MSASAVRCDCWEMSSLVILRQQALLSPSVSFLQATVKGQICTVPLCPLHLKK